jgi:membrane-bound lytic murein transglycosylase B
MNIKSGKIDALGAAALLAMGLSTPALAAKCGNNSSWLSSLDRTIQEEAARAGISKRTIDRAFANVRYATKTISLDRNQRSFKLSFEQFMQKRGANTIISQGKQLKQRNARLFDALEKKYGVPQVR